VSTLFERAGGREGVRAIVEDFYRHVEADAELRSVYPEDLTPGKEKLALFFEQWLGGPPAYSAVHGHPRLRLRHFPFVIGDRHAGKWLRYMRMAMQENTVPAEDVEVIFSRLGPLARHMVNEGQDGPRAPLEETRLD
jgi:hemoglobin